MMNGQFHTPFHLIILAVAVIQLASCQPFTQSIKDTFTPIAEEQGISRLPDNGRISGFITDDEALYVAEEALRSLPQYQNKPIYLYGDIHFYDDGRISAKLRHPTNPEYIDEYDYEDGVWGNPQALQLSANENIADKLIPLDSVPFITVATMVRNYNEKTETVTGAETTNHAYLVIRPNGASSWLPDQVRGDYEKWNIRFRLDGSVALSERK